MLQKIFKMFYIYKAEIENCYCLLENTSKNDSLPRPKRCDDTSTTHASCIINQLIMIKDTRLKFCLRIVY